jgi:SAM-dependent methyltransferase
MRNPERWTESKYIWHHGRWMGSRDSRELGVGSRLISDRIASLYQTHLAQHARGRLLDLGCGKVPLYGAYRHLASEVVCVDWPQSPHGDWHVDHAVDLSGPLPFVDASFDTLLLSDVLEHLPSPEALWREMARVLAPGGHLLMNVPFLYGIHEAPHDYARYTEFALRRFAKDAGFEVRHLQAVGGSLHVLADLLAKHLAHLPLLGTPLAAGVQGVVSALDRTAAGQRMAERTGSRFPLGYFMVAVRRGETAA